MILVYCLTIPEHIENIKILHMRTQKMNVDFILLGSILAKRNYDSNILRYQKNIFKKICEIMPFLYHKHPGTAFFHTSRHHLFLTLLFQKHIIYFISA